MLDIQIRQAYPKKKGVVPSPSFRSCKFQFPPAWRHWYLWRCIRCVMVIAVAKSNQKILDYLLWSSPRPKPENYWQISCFWSGRYRGQSRKGGGRGVGRCPSDLPQGLLHSRICSEVASIVMLVAVRRVQISNKEASSCIRDSCYIIKLRQVSWWLTVNTNQHILITSSNASCKETSKKVFNSYHKACTSQRISILTYSNIINLPSSEAGIHISHSVQGRDIYAVRFGLVHEAGARITARMQGKCSSHEAGKAIYHNGEFKCQRRSRWRFVCCPRK